MPTAEGARQGLNLREETILGFKWQNTCNTSGVPTEIEGPPLVRAGLKPGAIIPQRFVC